MAVTSIWRVHGSVGKVLDYVENAEKTTAVSTGDGDLSDVIDYAIQQRKTSRPQVRDGEEVVQRFVSGINCNPRTAKMEMQKIKKFYGKEDGVIAYHGYQSFAPGEATPELAHEIGVKLARQLWGDRYQVLVVYLRDDDDIQRLATNIMKNTTPKDSKSSDHFWEDMAAMLLKALISYLHYEAPPEEQNFPMVMDMIRAGDVKEDNEEYVSTLDELFERLERRNPEHIAVRYYKGYHSGSGKTLKSIQITLISHLEKFNLTSLAGITQTDEMELGEIGERKTAVFAVIPDSDSSYNFIVGMLYTQLFQQLYRKADFEHGGRLPVHVHFVMDEFANVALPDDFDKLLATMRSREISVSIILQNLAQLKALFDKQWESIVGNCDTFLYLAQ